MSFVLIAVAVLGLQAIAQQACSRRDARRFPPPGQLVAASTCQLHALAMGAGTALVGLVAPSLRTLYDYSWFVGFAVSFITYYGLMKFQSRRIVA